jgi:ceramide glucosyltransferase
VILLTILAIAGGYQISALIACLKRLTFREPSSKFTPGVSILKPIRGADPSFYEAIRSHALLDYPEFEILFGVRGRDDTAVPHIERLIAEFPQRDIRIVDVTTDAPNGKVGSMIDLARHARHPILLVNDSDIKVEPDYLRKVVAPLARPDVGLVTCLYRAIGSSLAGRFEALGVDTDFAPSTLVAPLVGIDEFALGSTLAVRREDLQRIGGFESIAEYIADDYQLGHRIHALGLKCYLAEPVVETHLGAATFQDAWQHQVRWARTIRACRGGGYLGLPVTFAGLWVVIGLAAGATLPAFALLAARMLLALVASLFVLRAATDRWMLLFVPLRDVWSAAVWVAGLAGRHVYWRDFSMELSPDGRIVRSHRR